VLKFKFHQLHSTVVNGVNAANITKIIDILIEKGALGHEDMSALQRRICPRQQWRALLKQLHTSENPEAFVQLYCAIRNQPRLQRLVDRIDDFELPGKCEASRFVTTSLLCGRPCDNDVMIMMTIGNMKLNLMIVFT